VKPNSLRRSVEDVGESRVSPKPPEGGLSEEGQKEVDRIEASLERMFEDASSQHKGSEALGSSVTKPTFEGGLRDESPELTEIERYRAKNVRLLMKVATLQAELSKYPMLDDPVLSKLSGRLTQNDRDVLEAMWDLSAFAAKPEKAGVIVEAALSSADEKSVFNNLKKEKLVAARSGPGGGYWLTELGVHMSIALWLLKA
jgi:hypothetical protein